MLQKLNGIAFYVNQGQTEPMNAQKKNIFKIKMLYYNELDVFQQGYLGNLLHRFDGTLPRRKVFS